METKRLGGRRLEYTIQRVTTYAVTVVVDEPIVENVQEGLKVWSECQLEAFERAKVLADEEYLVGRREYYIVGTRELKEDG